MQFCYSFEIGIFSVQDTSPSRTILLTGIVGRASLTKFRGDLFCLTGNPSHFVETEIRMLGPRMTERKGNCKLTESQDIF